MEQARERMFNFDYRAAIKLLEEDASKRNAKVEVLEMIGDCHRLLGNKDKAQQFYQKAIATRQCKSDIYRESGLIFLSIGKYPEAKKRFQFYADSLGGTAGDIPLLIATCDTAISWIAKKDSSVFKVSILPKVNSRYSDWGTEFLNKNLIFTSNRPQKKQKDMNPSVQYYTMYQSRAMKGKPNSFGPASILYNNITGAKHVGPIIFTKDQKTMYYTQTNVEISFKRLTEFGKIWENKIEILTAKVGANGPANIKPFKYNNPRKYSVGQPCLSPDNSTLYFVSDMPGGYGGTDIYYCRLDENGEWSAPENCGSMINTEGNEMFPTMDTSRVLYFSSNGHAGLGGLDIYRAKGDGDQWDQVENLRYPINSCGDDFHLIFNPNQQSGYLSSNRPGGMGSDDIYAFNLNSPLPSFGLIANPKLYENKLKQEREVVFKGTVTAQATGAPIQGATISFVDPTNNLQHICSTDSDGGFSIQLDKEVVYTYSCIRDGYIPTIKQSLSGNDIKLQKSGISIVMAEVKAKEENVIANNVFLDTGEGVGIEYSAQVMASKEYPDWNYLNKISETYPKLKIYYGSFPDAFTRFTVGRFATVKEATKLKNDLRKLGYKDAFVVMFINGERKVVSYN